MHIAVTRGAIAVMTPMFEHIELRAQDTIRVARTILRSLFPVSLTIFAPMMSVTHVWNNDEPTIIIPARSTIVVLL